MTTRAYFLSIEINTKLLKVVIIPTTDKGTYLKSLFLYYFMKFIFFQSFVEKHIDLDIWILKD